MKGEDPRWPVGDVMYGDWGRCVYCGGEVGRNRSGNLNPRHLTSNDQDCAAIARSIAKETTEIPVPAAMNHRNVRLV
jgi:hypothetical protein